MPFRKVQDFFTATPGMVCGEKITFLDEDDNVKVAYTHQYDAVPIRGEGDLKRLLKSGANIKEVDTIILGDSIGMAEPWGTETETETENKEV